MGKICTFTGNRPNKLPWGYNEECQQCISVKRKISDAVIAAIADGFDTFVCGMAQGGDFYFAEAVLEAAQSHNIFLECAIPFKGQENRWTQKERVRYGGILQRADEVTILSEYYTQWCMHARNRYMVDKSDRVIALDYCSYGGTRWTVDYAKGCEKEIIFIET